MTRRRVARLCDLQHIEIQALELTQHLGGDVRSPTLIGQLCGDEHGTAPVVRRAELHRAPERGQGDVDRALPPGPHPGLLELVGKLLVGPTDQRGTVPRTAIRIGVERCCEGFVHAPSLLHAGAAADRGADQRVAEANRVDVQVDEGRLDGGLQGVEIDRSAGYGASSFEGLVHGVLIAERGGEESEASAVGQVSDATRKRTLQPLGQRHSTSWRVPSSGRPITAGSSSKANGLPAASCITSPRVASGRRGAIASRRAPEVASSRPVIRCSGNPASVRPGGYPSRAAASRTTGSDSILRAMNASTSALERSSQCASSTMSNTGRSAESQAAQRLAREPDAAVDADPRTAVSPRIARRSR
jgi:hypothetical protein